MDATPLALGPPLGFTPPKCMTGSKVALGVPDRDDGLWSLLAQRWKRDTLWQFPSTMTATAHRTNARGMDLSGGAVDAIINPARMAESGLRPGTGFAQIVSVFLEGVLVRPRATRR